MVNSRPSSASTQQGNRSQGETSDVLQPGKVVESLESQVQFEEDYKKDAESAQSSLGHTKLDI